MYQKIISALLCLALLLGLAGCGAQTVSETSMQTTVSTEQSESSAPVETQKEETVSEDFDVADEPDAKTDFSKYEEKVSSSSQNTGSNDRDSQNDAGQSSGDAAQNSGSQSSGDAAQNPGSQSSGDAAQEEENSQSICYFTISCTEILDNMDMLTPGREAFVPENGLILEKSQVPFEKGETVFDVLKRVTRDCGIQMEFSYFPMYESMYIEGIGNLYEKDCGGSSGWFYFVNGVKPNYGVSKYVLEDQDNVEFYYTCG